MSWGRWRVTSLVHPGGQYLSTGKAFIEYSNDMQDVYKNIEECKTDKKRKILIASDDAIADMIYNKPPN